MNTNDTRPTTLKESVREHWRYYWLAWAFPLIFATAVLVLPFAGKMFWLAALPYFVLFYYAGYRANTPYRRGWERRSHAMILGGLFPFLIWTFFIISPLLLVHLLLRNS